MIDQAKASRVLAFMRLLKDPKGGKLKQRKFIKWLPCFDYRQCVQSPLTTR